MVGRALRRVEKTKKPSLLQIVRSVLAAAIGVQSRANQEKDFNSHSLARYITVGILFTAAFIFMVTAVVQGVLSAT